MMIWDSDEFHPIKQLDGGCPLVYFAAVPQQEVNKAVVIPSGRVCGHEKNAATMRAWPQEEISKLGNGESGIVFNIQRYQIHDGPGIRTLVLLKGCPLRCQWCSNPEGQKREPQLYYLGVKCRLCGRCVEACAPHGNAIVDGKMTLNRGLCVLCGECVEECLFSAREIKGKSMTVAEVVKEVEKDRSFYFTSGGGITLGGGELLAQARFSKNILKTCKRIGINTAIETSAYGQWDDLKQILASTDWVFCDLKTVDQRKHKEGTGSSNELILENCKKLSQTIEGQEIHLTVRIPVVPGFNDSEESIVAIADFVRQYMPAANEIELLRYHSLALGKYQNLGMEYRLPELAPSSEAAMIAIKELIEKAGVKCIYEGAASEVYVGAK
jgi:pyruvate formate lyase activating enzyme